MKVVVSHQGRRHSVQHWPNSPFIPRRNSAASFGSSDVCCGSKSAETRCQRHVRFASDSDRMVDITPRQQRAKSGHRSTWRDNGKGRDRVAYCHPGTLSTRIVSSSGEIEPEVLHDEPAKGFAIRQMSRLGHAIAYDVDALVHDVDAPFLGDSTSEDVVGEEGIWSASICSNSSSRNRRDTLLPC